MKVIIVGGVAGGASAAARLRRLDEKAEIVVYERSGYISYANCGLPYYIGGSITDPEALTLQTPQSFNARFNVAMKVRHEVCAIDTGKKTVTRTRNGEQTNLINAFTWESEWLTFKAGDNLFRFGAKEGTDLLSAVIITRKGYWGA